jgi:hypothetical protein
MGVRLLPLTLDVFRQGELFLSLRNASARFARRSKAKYIAPSLRSMMSSVMLSQSFQSLRVKCLASLTRRYRLDRDSRTTRQPGARSGTLPQIGPPSPPVPATWHSKTTSPARACLIKSQVMPVSGIFARRVQHEFACPASVPELM